MVINSSFKSEKYINQMYNNQLESILSFKEPAWTREMILAFKLGLIYSELERQYFPDYKTTVYPQKKDPRKSELFKLCYKMVNDNLEKLKPEQYRHFIQAQLSILKNIKAGPAKELFYGPRCLIGEPAWGRWLVWKRYANAQKVVETAIVEVDYDTDFLRTKMILENKLKPLNKETLTEAIQSGQLFRMAMLKAVAPMFLRCCPLVQQYLAKHPEILRLYDIKMTEAAPIEAVRSYEKHFQLKFN